MRLFGFFFVCVSAFAERSQWLGWASEGCAALDKSDLTKASEMIQKVNFEILEDFKGPNAMQAGQVIMSEPVQAMMTADASRTREACRSLVSILSTNPPNGDLATLAAVHRVSNGIFSVQQALRKATSPRGHFDSQLAKAKASGQYGDWWNAAQQGCFDGLYSDGLAAFESARRLENDEVLKRMTSDGILFAYVGAVECAIKGKLWDEAQRWLMLWANRATSASRAFPKPLIPPAQALWKAGKRDAVVAYFEICASKSWAEPKAQDTSSRWLREVRRGKWPKDAVSSRE
jgi:hypothetical protein